MIWVSRSCPRSKSCKPSTPSSWRKRKKTYAEYRALREEMRELLKAKENVDRILNMKEEKQAEKDRNQTERS